MFCAFCLLVVSCSSAPLRCTTAKLSLLPLFASQCRHHPSTAASLLMPSSTSQVFCLPPLVLAIVRLSSHTVMGRACAPSEIYCRPSQHPQLSSATSVCALAAICRSIAHYLQQCFRLLLISVFSCPLRFLVCGILDERKSEF